MRNQQQNSKKRKILKTLFKWFLILFLGHIFYVLILRWVNPPITVTQLNSVFAGDGLKRDYVSYENISRNAKLAVIAGEDQLFPDHDGFDIKAIKKAIKYNQKHPNRIRGASTISQQVAKNVFLWQGGGFFRKGLEAYNTFLIELLWPKKRILEMYLNVAEMGKGIYGIESAAENYFNTSAKNLSASQAAQIAAALPNPVKYTVKPTSSYVKNRSQFILRQMNNLSGDPDIEAVVQ